MRGRIGVAAVVLSTAVSLLGVSAPAGALSVDPPALEFGEVMVGDSATQVVSLTFDAGKQFGGSIPDPPFALDAYKCALPSGGFVGPGTCKAKVTFAPTEGFGFTRTLVVVECAVGGGGCTPVLLSVHGTGKHALNAHPDDLNFGNVRLGTTKTKIATIKIDAGYHYSGIGFPTSGVPEYTFDDHTCGIGPEKFVGPGTCHVKITFAPLDHAGLIGATLLVFECKVGDPGCPVPVTAIRARGTGVALVQARP